MHRIRPQSYKIIAKKKTLSYRLTSLKSLHNKLKTDSGDEDLANKLLDLYDAIEKAQNKAQKHRLSYTTQ